MEFSQNKQGNLVLTFNSPINLDNGCHTENLSMDAISTMEIKEITYDRYLQLLNVAKELSPKVGLNCTDIEHEDGTIYLQSNEGISYLKQNGLLGGLTRFKKGNEKIAKLHQETRITLGGTFLECFDGKLVEIYQKQGFNVVARLKFNPEFAPKGWQQDKDLSKKPDVVFMSIHKRPIQSFDDYDEALQYSTSNKTILVRMYRPQRDKDNRYVSNILQALKLIKKELTDVKNVVQWGNITDIYFKDTNDYIRINKSK